MPSGRSTALVVAASSPWLAFCRETASNPPESARPGGDYSKTDARTGRRVSCQRLTEIEDSGATNVGHSPTPHAEGSKRPDAWFRLATVWNLDVRGLEFGAVGEGSRQRRLSMTASKRGISGAMSYSSTSATVIQSPACCAFEQRRQLGVERAEQRHRRTFARLERLERDAARGGGGDDELYKVGDRLGELADAARRGLDLGAAQDVASSHADAATAGSERWPRRARCRGGRSDAASRSRRSARCPGPGRGRRHRGSPARRPRRSAPPRQSRPDGATCRSTASRSGPQFGTGMTGTKAVPFSRTVATMGCSSCSRRAAFRPIGRPRCEIPAGPSRRVNGPDNRPKCPATRRAGARQMSTGRQGWPEPHRNCTPVPTASQPRPAA